jgi:RNA polymerase sigma factor FliA
MQKTSHPRGLPHTPEDLRREANFPLWVRLRDGDRSARGDLVARYTPLVKYVIGRMAVSPCGALDSDDMFAAGMIGLLQAVDRFNAEQGVRFETYALQRIRGAIIDAIRSISPVSRTSLRRSRLLEEKTAALTQVLGRAPVRHELALEMGISIAEVERMQVESTHAIVSLDGGRDDGDTSSIGDSLYDPNALAIDDDLREPDEMVGRLNQALESLPDRDRLVLSHYYTHERTLKQISRVIDVSESRVSQIRSAAVEKLSVMLRNNQAAWAA